MPKITPTADQITRAMDLYPWLSTIKTPPVELIVRGQSVWTGQIDLGLFGSIRTAFMENIAPQSKRCFIRLTDSHLCIYIYGHGRDKLHAQVEIFLRNYLTECALNRINK